MQLARLVRALGVVLVLGLAGSVVGCGPGAEQGSTAEKADTKKAIAKSIGEEHKAAAAAKKAAARGPEAAP